jgi:UDP-glucose 4-epimerase
MNETILVTGGAGFIGSHTVDLLISKGYNVVIVDNLIAGKRKNVNEKARVYEIDIRDEKLCEIFEKEKPDAVIHLAAQTNARKSIEDPEFDKAVNVDGALNVLECCKKTGVKKIVYASSAAVYGDPGQIPTSEDVEIKPLSPYGTSKYEFELHLQNSGISFVILRYSNVYGPRQDAGGEAGVVSIFVTKLLKKEQPVIFSDGEQTRDFIYVSDVAKANVLALESNISGIFNISTGKETSVTELFRLLKIAAGSDIEARHSSAIEGEIRRSCLDCSKAEGQLGWKAEVEIGDGLKKTVEWFSG